MRKCFGFSFLAAVAAFWLLGGMVAAQAQSECDDEPPGPARAFCQAFCDLGKCTTPEEQPPGIAQACDNVRVAYENATGEQLPCLGAVCPCFVNGWNVDTIDTAVGGLLCYDPNVLGVSGSFAAIGPSGSFGVVPSLTAGPFLCNYPPNNMGLPTEQFTNLTISEANDCKAVFIIDEGLPEGSFPNCFPPPE